MPRTPKPEQRQPGEDVETYRHRRGPWNAMANAVTPLKTARSHVQAAVHDLRRQMAVAPNDRCYAREIPASQRERVASWEAAVTDVLAILNAIDADAWQDEVRQEIACQPTP
ncbi:hypothetical protein AB0F17_61870 [Nonomuraea sp. NPDC026600]|uniref:hypothetical protein n=1 Tax=Nonomuraea sp. NPDC026600 TaxID=3155363 RepID=UPI0033EAD305